jgi:hypothetical protein
MKKQIKLLISSALILMLVLSLASAMGVKSVDAENFQPGSEQEIAIKVKNTLSDNAKDVSLNLNIPSGTPFIVVDSDNSVDEIESDDTESFDFTIKASNSAISGDYSIPYTITYSNSTGTAQTPKTGIFILTVEAEPKLVYSVNADNPIIGSIGKIKFSIVNQGLGDAKFVSITLIPQGYTLVSDAKKYIGTINSDDSQTESFDAVFNEQSPMLNAKIEYKNFNNEAITENVNLPIKVYSGEQALKLGLIKKDSTGIYIIGSIIIFAVWMITRKIRKKRRLNKAQGR